ncbi:hypothetical protein [Rhizobium leguminosarum]|uniref:hypothetical protein n=1 Tax=Rhizobium leguminosarum TaxID=384 RepID=UPI001C98918B|nr:hypothetical protein [Rhizobium leguminosarum]MBY5332162.1 hypothetical protein [Rhizobium leguminosarum]
MKQWIEFSVLVVWVVSSMCFLPILVSVIYLNGYSWIYSTPSGVLLIGVIGTYTGMLVIAMSPKGSDNEIKKQISHAEEALMASNRALLFELTGQIGRVESAVDDLDRKTRV